MALPIKFAAEQWVLLLEVYRSKLAGLQKTLFSVHCGCFSCFNTFILQYVLRLFGFLTISALGDDCPSNQKEVLSQNKVNIFPCPYTVICLGKYMMIHLGTIYEDRSFGQEEALNLLPSEKVSATVTFSLSHLFRHRQASLWPPEAVGQTSCNQDGSWLQKEANSQKTQVDNKKEIRLLMILLGH